LILRTWLAAGIAASASIAALLTGAAPASAIVGGSNASHAYPSTVSVQREHPDGTFSHTCGGSVISYRGHIGVETNAHCVTVETGDALPADQIRLSVDSTELDGGQIITVTSIIVHIGWDWAAPGPNGPDEVDDIAVLIPASTHGLHPIDITDRADPAWVRFLGWGSTRTTGEGPLPETLQQLDGNHITSPAACTDVFISTGEICLTSPVGTGPCYGDSGTGAVVLDHGTLALLGSASRLRDDTCGTGPAVYTDVRYFRSWLQQVLLTGISTRRPHLVVPADANRDQFALAA
jgi:secreted trypsin-like serine protease